MSESCASCFGNLYIPYFGIWPILKFNNSLGYIVSKEDLEYVPDYKSVVKEYPRLKDLTVARPSEIYYNQWELPNLNLYRELFDQGHVGYTAICKKDFKKIEGKLSLNLDDFDDGILFLMDQRTYPTKGFLVGNPDKRKHLSVPSRRVKTRGYISSQNVRECLPILYMHNIDLFYSDPADKNRVRDEILREFREK